MKLVELSALVLLSWFITWAIVQTYLLPFVNMLTNCFV